MGEVLGESEGEYLGLMSMLGGGDEVGWCIKAFCNLGGASELGVARTETIIAYNSGMEFPSMGSVTLVCHI